MLALGEKGIAEIIELQQEMVAEPPPLRPGPDRSPADAVAARLLLATGNAHKVAEVQSILGDPLAGRGP